MDAILAQLRELSFCSMCLRVFLAMALGGLLGYDREKSYHPAGFRTYMLVAMAAAATAMLSQYLDVMLDTFWRDALAVVGRRTDVVRLGARVVSGIGFLGTGTILITERKEVSGLTTASCLWAAACMGLAIGAGFYEGVIIGFIIIYGALRLLPPLEKAILAKSIRMNIFMELDSVKDLYLVSSYLKELGIYIYDVEMGNKEKLNGAFVTGLFSLKLPKREKHTELLAKLATLPGVAAIEEV